MLIMTSAKIGLLTHSNLGILYSGKVMMAQSVEREVAGLNPGQINTQGLKITEDEGADFALISAKG